MHYIVRKNFFYNGKVYGNGKIINIPVLNEVLRIKLKARFIEPKKEAFYTPKKENEVIEKKKYKKGKK